MGSTNRMDGDGLERLSRALRGRYRMRKALHGGARGLATGSLAALLLMGADRLLLPRVAPHVLDPWLVAIPLVGLVLGAVIHLAPALWRLSKAELLALADRAYGSKELMLTAEGQSPEATPMMGVVQGRAETLARSVSPGKVLPFSVPREAFVALVLIAILGLSPFIPQYVPSAVAKELQDKRQAATAGEKLKEEIARLEKEVPAPRSEEIQKALEKAGKLAENMAKGNLDRLTSLEKLAEAQDDAGKAKQDLKFDEVQSSFSRAAKDLEKEGLKGDLSHALGQADARALGDELKKLADELTKPTKLDQQELGQVAEAFSRMAKALDRQGESALSKLAQEASDALKAGKTDEAAKSMEQMAQASQLEPVVKDPQKSSEAARALDASEQTQATVEKMRSQDAAGTRSELQKLAKSIREGKLPESYDEKQRQAVAKALKQLGNELGDTKLKSLAQSLGKAGDQIQQGNLKDAAQTLKDIDASSLKACNAMQQGDSRMSDLSRALSEARAMMGQSQELPKGTPSLSQILGQGEPQSDFGVGTSHDDSGDGKQADAEHHNQDRTGDSKSTWTEKYEKKYESLRLQGAQGSPTFVQGKPSGPADYIEFRGLPGQEQSMMDVGAAPANYRKAAEDALSNEEIPPGYRDQIKQYFDTIPKAAGDEPPPHGAGKGSDAPSAPAAPAGGEAEKKHE